MRFGALLLLLGGCQRLFDLRSVPDVDAPRAADAGGDGSAAPPDDAPPGVALVQHRAVGSTTTSSLSITLQAQPTAGDVLVVFGGAENGISTIAGGGVTTWQSAASSGVSPTIYVWYGITDGSSRSVTMVMNSSAKAWGDVAEWSRLDTANPFDTQTAMGMAAGSASSGTIDLQVTTTAAPDLLVFGVSCYGGVGTPAGMWTTLDTVGAAATVTLYTWYQVANTAGAEAATASFTNDWDAALVAFHALP